MRTHRSPSSPTCSSSGTCSRSATHCSNNCARGRAERPTPMDDIVKLLPIAAFIALAAGLAVVLRGTGRIVKRTRELEQFRGAVHDLAARVDASLGAAAGQIDAVRRRQVGPETIGETIVAATDAVEHYADEAKALRGPRTAQE